MKRLLYLILILLSFNSYSQSAIDSLSSIDQFGRVRDGIIAQNIINVLNTDPSGVKLTENEKQYIRTIVNGLYTTGVWQKCKAVYGFVGGNEWKHKWNWKDMRDLDGAFRLVFINSPTHSVNGVQGNATSATFNNNAIINTFINPSLNISTNFFSFFVYNNIAPSNSFSATSMGAINQIGLSFQRNFFLNRLNNKNFTYKNLQYQYASENSFNGSTFTYQNTSGTFLINNGILKSYTQTTLSDGLNAYANAQIHLLGRSFHTNGIFTEYQNPSNERIATAIFVDGEVSSNQALQASQIITFAQSILNRQ